MLKANTRVMSENFRFDRMLNNIDYRLTYAELTSNK